MKRVLVVEDEYAIRDLITLNLKIAGYDVVGAESAEGASRAVSGRGAPEPVSLMTFSPG